MSDARGINRRSFFRRVTGAVLGAGAVIAVSPDARAVTDGDPTDRANQGRGCTADTDPTDQARCGSARSGGARSAGFVLLVAGAGAAAVGTYLRRKKS